MGRADRWLGRTVVLALLLTACSTQNKAAPAPRSSPSSSTSASSHPTLWLCQPSTTDDPCDAPLSATAVSADGSQVAEAAPAAQQPIDCFYVYPTVSEALTTNAPLRATSAETRTARAQVARFSSVCRVWAPVYRQLTVHALLTGGFGDTQARDLAHNDVVAAWHDYLARNPGRRFVLIGHSQGSFELLRLLQEEVDGQPAIRSRLVSALLLGGNVKVPPGKDVGGDLQHVPLCSSPHQTGCLVAYNTYDTTPPANALFGRPDRARGLVAACTNPAALGGGVGTLRPYFPTPALTRGLPAFPGTARIRTPWVSYPDYVSAACREQNGSAWLQVTVQRAPRDTRPASIPKTLGPAWGLHLVDVNLALGNLVDLVRTESTP